MLHQRVGYGYTFVSIFTKTNLTIIPIIFYDDVLIRHIVTLDPTLKPNVIVY